MRVKASATLMAAKLDRSVEAIRMRVILLRKKESAQHSALQESQRS
jgi:hypothetical protein